VLGWQITISSSGSGGPSINDVHYICMQIIIDGSRKLIMINSSAKLLLVLDKNMISED
jgi:hypothetical protein